MVNHGRLRRSIGLGVLATYWLMIFTATHWPIWSHKPHFSGIYIWDKVAHFIAYTGLAVLLAWVLQGGRRPTLVGYAAVLVIVACYGVLDEALQSITRRSPDLRDWLADVSGACCGLVLHRLAISIVGRADRGPAASEPKQTTRV